MSRNAFALRSAGQMDKPAAITTVCPQLQARTAEGAERLLLGYVGRFLQADTQSGTHSKFLPDRGLRILRKAGSKLTGRLRTLKDAAAARPPVIPNLQERRRASPVLTPVREKRWRQG